MSRSYDEVAKEVDSITDSQNTSIDQGIKSIVIALRLHSFPTDGSCEGHLSEGLPYPWVEIYAPEQEEEAWKRANTVERTRLSLLLDKFYKETTKQPVFTYEDIGMFGGFRLVPVRPATGNNDVRQELEKYQQNFDKLAEFLQRQHL